MADREEASTVLRIRVASSTCGAGQGNASTMLGQLLGSVLLAIRCVPEVGSAGEGSSGRAPRFVVDGAAGHRPHDSARTP